MLTTYKRRSSFGPYRDTLAARELCNMRVAHIRLKDAYRRYAAANSR